MKSLSLRYLFKMHANSPNQWNMEETDEEIPNQSKNMLYEERYRRTAMNICKGGMTTENKQPN